MPNSKPQTDPLAHLLHDLKDMERRLAELTRMRDGLRTLVEACPGHGALDQCPIVGALGGEA